jgi:dolichol-phosphate mannosyltransferase
MTEPVPSAATISPLTGYVAPQLAVVVPTFNEVDNIELLYERLATALSAVPWEMIVVDDDSPDGTAERVNELARIYPNVRGLRRIGRRGLSSACIEGMAATAAPYVAVIDADLQHDETILPRMLEAALSGADLVVGSRFAASGSAGDGLSSTRLRASEMATRMAGLVAGNRVSDPMSGFFLVRREIFLGLAPQLASEGFKILLDLIVSAERAGLALTVAEVPYVFRPRHAGESKMTPLIAVQYLGLWGSKLTGGLLPPTFLLFALVGGLGVGVHLGVLQLLTAGLGMDFVPAQILATLIAMTSNFFLNNALTYADRKLRGRRLWTGLLGFYAICSLGGLANVSIATLIYEWNHMTLVAGLAGAVMSSVFNYAVTRAFTWR